MVRCGILFEVRTEFLNNIWISFDFKGLILLSHHIPMTALQELSQKKSKYDTLS
jgi:hypothetical protein